MELKLKLPMDYRSSRWFRVLSEQLQSPAVATLAFLSLWRELAYLARDGNFPGRLTLSDRAMFESELGRDGQADPADVFAKLVNCGVLRAEAHDDHPSWLCPLFQADNADLCPGRRSKESRGGLGRSYALAMDRFERSAGAQSLLLNAELLVDEQGQPLDPDTIKNLQRLVLGLDGAFGRPQREQFMWTATLVQDALPVLRRHNPQRLYEFCRQLNLLKGHPSLLGMTAEKFLPRFEEFVGALGLTQEL